MVGVPVDFSEYDKFHKYLVNHMHEPSRSSVTTADSHSEEDAPLTGNRPAEFGIQRNQFSSA